MKTTIEISDDLTRRARAYAASKRTTLRALDARPDPIALRGPAAQVH